MNLNKKKFKIWWLHIAVFTVIFTFVFSPLGNLVMPYLPEKTAENIETKTAQAITLTDQLILFWDPADGTIPTNWTCISCSAQAYDNLFPVASVSAGVTGGGSHQPAAANATLSVPSTTAKGTGTAATVSDATHTHGTLAVTTVATNSRPKFATLQMIKSPASLTSIPQNVIAMFDATPPAGWTTYAGIDDNIILASGSGAGPVTGGSDTHNHAITWPALGNSSEGKTINGGGNSAAPTVHAHTAPASTNTDTLPNVPRKTSVILAKANAGGVSSFTNVIAMFDINSPDTGQWTVLSGVGGTFDNAFIEASTSVGFAAVSGSNVHTHGAATSGASSANDGTPVTTGSATTAGANGHTHTLSTTFSESNFRPAFKTVVVAKGSAAAEATITLTLDDGGVEALGTLTSGTRKTATTRLKAEQTNASSLTITAGRLRAITNVTLASNAAPLITSNQVSDTAGGIDVFDGLGASCTDGTGPAVWPSQGGVSYGLGFTLWLDSNSSKETACWGTGTTETDALNKYAALQASASASSFINIAASPPATLYTSIGYSLDVSSTQKATDYAGGIVFTATVSP